MKEIIFSLFYLFTGTLANAQSRINKDSTVVHPNIIWIVCEDISMHLSCFGETEIKTPNLDALAKDGVKYTNTYAVAGVCAPSRAGIISGMYPMEFGADNMRNFSETKKKPAKPMISGFPSYSVVPPAYFKGFPEFLRRAGYYCTNNPKEDYQFEAPVTMWDESSEKATYKNRPSGKPFFAIFNLDVTHESFIWKNAKLPLTVDPKKVIVPPYYPDIREIREDIARNLSNVVIMDEQAGKIIQNLKDEGLYDNSIIFFYSDHGDGLPYVKREVLMRGLHIPLIIKYPKNKYAGQTDPQLISGVDLGATVLSLAGVPVPAYMKGRAFTGIQSSKSERKYIYAARDRMDDCVDRVRAVYDGHYQYIRNYMPKKPRYQNIEFRLQQRGMRRIISLRDSGLLNQTQMLWFKAPKPVHELYDIQNDPDELNNLADNSAYKTELEKLQKVMNKWEAEGDWNATPEAELIKKMWNGKSVLPSTDVSVVTETKQGLYIHCRTPGASIGYKIIKAGTELPADCEENRKDWMIYNFQPVWLNKGDQIIIKAQRIGYKSSELIYTK
ncbi:MAG: sulfatase [Ginsengibacter sp.]